MYLLGSGATAQVPADVSLLVVRTRYAPRNTASKVTRAAVYCCCCSYLPQTTQPPWEDCSWAWQAPTIEILTNGVDYLGDDAYVRSQQSIVNSGQRIHLRPRRYAVVCSVRGCGYLRPCVVVRWFMTAVLLRQPQGMLEVSVSPCDPNHKLEIRNCRRAPAQDESAVGVHLRWTLAVMCDWKTQNPARAVLWTSTSHDEQHLPMSRLNSSDRFLLSATMFH